MSRTRAWLAAVAVAALALVPGQAMATTLADVNLVDLLRESDSIVIGHVKELSDGIDGRGLPYTEVTLVVSETLTGEVGETYTFRQFGLREARLSDDGTRKMLPAPDVFPKYDAGEQVILFLNRRARYSGLQTTVGLATGKFTLGSTRAENGLANQGVFRNVALQDGLATANDLRMLNTEIGAVNGDTFVSFVRRAIQENWIPRGMMWREDEGPPPGSPKPDKPVRPAPGTPSPLQGSPSPTGSQTFGTK